MRSRAHFRSFGTLRYLLELARSKFETEPTVAVQITAAVLDFVDAVEGPSHVHEIGLRGLARKEHGNALRATGDLRGALAAAEEAERIYLLSPALVFDATKAKLVAAQVLHEIGESERAMKLARECGRTFADFGEVSYRIMARHTEGCVLFACRQFREALAIFGEIVADAEREGDRNLLVRGLHNAAECARELGDLAAARDLYPRVLRHMEELGLTTERPRVMWGYALTLAAEGKTAAAISELYKVNHLYLHLGMNLDAATAALDIVRIRLANDEDVQVLCGQLVDTFAKAGAAQNALEALAYLREQAKKGAVTLAKIASVRTYFGELARKPSLLFARPSEDRDD